ncbi:hypothetical protein [Chryseosolibacter indicus]|uniref:WG repeat-containing protein n=1 Tax=Chryseosolibacter indicus TaxID=2782351 RepID=A0ABS5VS08_9BACT|nr:hypothetical protein [Chryseosolibacter indicus]MBT1704233.1 hypothetical protein [Chryseosolibacter indicus]
MFRLVYLLLLFCVTHAFSQELVWHAHSVYKTVPHDTASAYKEFYLASLDYVKEGKVQWTIDVPEQMRKHVALSTFVHQFKEANKAPVDINDQKDFLRCPEYISDNAVIISHKNGVLILSKKTGEILEEILYPQEQQFYVDSGRFAITKGSKVWSGIIIQHGATFIWPVEEYIFHFNGTQLFIFRDNKLFHTITYNAKEHLKKSERGKLKAVFKYRKYKVTVEGIVYL